MDAFVINGGKDLVGEVDVSGSKNAGLAIMAAALLASGESILEGVPFLGDMEDFSKELSHLGADVKWTSDFVKINTENLQSRHVPSGLTSKVRASVLLLGPLLTHFGYAKISLPGGCAIGRRPIDEHIYGLERLGASIKLENGYVEAHAPGGLKGADVLFHVPTVTGTMNVMLAASLAHGVTNIQNAAREPEVQDLATCLIRMGCTVEGAGTNCIAIHGRSQVIPYKYRVMGDRIECGTFLVAGAMAGNPLKVNGCIYEHQSALIAKLREVGALVEINGHSITVYKAKEPKAVNIKTGPYPSFPTDMQPQFMALLSMAQGVSMVLETVFELRFNQAIGLGALGAHITVVDRLARVQTVRKLTGSTVAATDLRAGASLVLAGLVADGNTVLRCIYHIDRGYNRFDNKLVSVGASIRRLCI